LNLFFGRVPPDHEPSASLGVVSAIHRYSDIYSDAIQVDVAVNRGNSGGPLLTLDGKAVGINGKIETRFAFGINTGVGYAIPSNQIKNFLDALKGAGGGLVRHGVLPGLGVAERAADKRGLEVIEVQKGTGAEKAGFQKGDLILSIEGYPIVTRNRIRGVLNTFPAEREITVKVARGSEIKDLKVKLEARRPRLPPGTRRV